ncbi:TonB-dependent receptor [Membranihabitans marinus]|uniref:TonB-dependent receptor n=1 Tax=Membranihabitans marinus TaxID=1227546 RepID=UPI001F014EA1|nr:TonB-dependent receptor [Membranihabitans marinus]
MRNIAILFMTLFAQNLFGQNLSIEGKIVDENNLNLAGAAVYLNEAELGTYTDESGHFSFNNLENKTYHLDISFIGYQSIEVSKNPSQDNNMIEVSLQPGVIMGQEILILGDRLKGQSKALNQQRSNMNISNIVASDQIGRFPDANIGDAMKRIPGITMQGDQGEARNIIVRGLAPHLNSVTINGDRIPSAEAENRNIQMDLIPSDMIQTIEVNKSVTPNLDADAIGGSVNLTTRPAPNDTRISATLASGYNFLSEKPNLTGGLIYGTRLAKDKLGIILSTSYNDNKFGSDNVEAEWENEAESPLTGDDIEVSPYINNFQIRQYEVQRIRRSFSANLDYKFNNDHSIFVRGMYNWRDDRENRYVNEIDDIEPVFQDDTENIVGYEGIGIRESKAGIDSDRNRNTRLEDQRVRYMAIEGQHQFNNAFSANWVLSLANASEERLNERYIVFETEDAFALNHNISNAKFPLITASEPIDLATYELDEITDESQFTEENDFNARVDFGHKIHLFDHLGEVKWGVKYRNKDKSRDNTFDEYSPVNDNIENLSMTELINKTKSNFLPGSKYQAGDFASAEYLGKMDLFNSSLFEKESKPDEYLPGNFEASEDVLAAYAMVEQKFSDKFSTTLGLRMEHTQLEYLGNELADSEELIKQNRGESSYTNFLPGIHLKYDLTHYSILRLSWSNTLARPNYYDLVPYRDVIAEDEEIFAGNPNLEPTQSSNIDLMAEHYFNTVGIVSGGFFYKKIDKFIYLLEGEDQATGYDLFQPQNGANANLYGFEVAFQKQLDFLPNNLKGLGIYLNYTYIGSKAEGVRNEDGELREDISLPGASPQMFNASLSYELKKWVARLSLNFSDAYIDELGDSDFYDRYYGKQFFLDFNASYAITDNWRVFVEANNLTNQPLRYYQGVSQRTMQMEYYNSRINIGIKYDFFKK